VKFNVKNTEGLRLPPGKTDIIHFDDEVPGFGLRLREGGRRSWVFQYQLGTRQPGANKALQRRMSLGKYPAVSVSGAREEASRLYARVRLGQDPAGERKRELGQASEIFGAVARLFLARQRGRVKPRSYVEIEHHLLTHCRPLHGLSFGKIDRRVIAQRLTEITQTAGPAAANRMRATLSALFSWAMREGLAESNPALATNKNDEVTRDRVLKAAELHSLWGALPPGDFGAIVKLLVLTGSRQKEIADLRWSEIDAERKVIQLPAERVKNGRAHEIPMSGAVTAILEAQIKRKGRDFIFGEGQGGFSGFGKCKKRLDEAINLKTPWILHDLRRTAATGMAEIGVQPHIVEAVLNHISGHKGGVAGIYNRASYEAEKATALARWADHVTNIVENRQGNVAPFKRA
jgi:integrase